MGGHQGGRAASRAVCSAFRQEVQGNTSFSDPRAALLQGLSAANKAVRETARQHPELEGLGSTVVAVLLNERSGRFSFLSVGDSPLYCLRRGVLLRLNESHSLQAELTRQVALGNISAKEAESHPGRHTISSAVMGDDIPLVDCRNGLLLPGELLLLASDGVQTLDDGEDGILARLLEHSPSPELAVRNALGALQKADAPHQDNATLVAVRLEALEEGKEPEGNGNALRANGGDTLRPRRDEDETGLLARKKRRKALLVLAFALLLCAFAVQVWFLPVFVTVSVEAPERPPAHSGGAWPVSGNGTDGLPEGGAGVVIAPEAGPGFEAEAGEKPQASTNATGGVSGTGSVSKDKPQASANARGGASGNGTVPQTGPGSEARPQDESNRPGGRR